VFPLPTVNFPVMPWDFVLIILVLGILIPWRGAARMKRLLAKPELGAADRLSLYGSTVVFQWAIAAVVAWRALARMLSPDELGLAVFDSWRVASTAIVLTALLGINQIVSLRRLAGMPEGKRGSVFAIANQIIPRTTTETCVYVGLACTASVSEEFLYRGFVFAVFARLFAHSGFSSAAAVSLSSAWFSMAHLYQGPRGLLTTYVVAIIFALVRIWSGSLIPAVVAHIGY